VRVAPKALTADSWYLWPFFWNQRRKYGKVLDTALLWARSPKLFIAVALLYGAIDRKRSPIDPALRSLLTVRVSQLNHCRFCVDLNAATLLQRGVGEEKLWALDDWRGSNLFDGRERVVLEYTDAMTLSDQEADDLLMTRLRGHFDDDAIVELTALIAFQNMSPRSRSRRRASAASRARRRRCRGAVGENRSRTGIPNDCRGGNTMIRMALPTMPYGIGGALALLAHASPALAQPQRYWGPEMLWGGWFHMFFGFLMLILFLGSSSSWWCWGCAGSAAPSIRRSALCRVRASAPRSTS
jgi:AhpD family alkylhydroperoxidase